ncbi:WCX domain-containing protein [Saccharopolyspora elongata]
MYKRRVEVLAPPELRERIAASARTMATLHD